MNRYTFKAKRKDNGEWVYGYYLYSPHDEKNYIFSGNNGYGLNDCREFDYYEIIPETLCQCTGLQDRDGNYIFENDIVENYYDDEKQILDVRYYNCGLVFIDRKDYSHRFTTDSKIIGNKFDKEVE